MHTKDIREVYPEVPGLDARDYHLPAEGLTPEHYQRALQAFKNHLGTAHRSFMGYQTAQNLHYKNDLADLMDVHLNNIGDPFGTGNFILNTKILERAVLDYYAALWHARWPHDPADEESYWGYCLSMGSTEGNLYAMWNAREYLSGRFLLHDQSEGSSRPGRPRRLLYAQGRAPSANPNAFTPVTFYSEDTHYSFVKNGVVLGLQTFYEVGTARYPDENPLAPGKPWPHEVPSQGGAKGPGCIDVDALLKLVEFFAKKGHPCICTFNFGSTFKGAYDDVETAGKALMPIFEKHGLAERKIHLDAKNYHVRNGYWIHVDGALGASYMPFVEQAHARGLIQEKGPIFDFRLPFVNSLVTSGHKWIGSPWASGIFMTKTKYQMRPPDDPAYIGSPDTTLAGSRNAHTPAILWCQIARTSHEKQMQRALSNLELADYAVTRIRQLGEHTWAERTPLALAVRFKQANPEIIRKFSLASESLYVDGVLRTYNHLFTMDGVTREMLDDLVEALRAPDAFPDQSAHAGPGASQEAPDVHHAAHLPVFGRGFR